MHCSHSNYAATSIPEFHCNPIQNFEIYVHHFLSVIGTVHSIKSSDVRSGYVHQFSKYMTKLLPVFLQVASL